MASQQLVSADLHEQQNTTEAVGSSGAAYWGRVSANQSSMLNNWLGGNETHQTDKVIYKIFKGIKADDVIEG